ncbi:hypothetical protein F2P57_17720 [[Clostridium] symbiosum]|nr:hypothetical protein F2P57_17720 [[Clostridium] symbiosum]
MRTQPGRPADGVAGCIYESFIPGGWHRWLEKEILWFCFRRAEPERMISGWTASSRDSSRANVLPDIILSFSAGRCRQYLLLPEGFRRNERLCRVYRPRPLACGR